MKIDVDPSKMFACRSTCPPSCNLPNKVSRTRKKSNPSAFAAELSVYGNETNVHGLYYQLQGRSKRFTNFLAILSRRIFQFSAFNGDKRCNKNQLTILKIKIFRIISWKKVDIMKKQISLASQSFFRSSLLALVRSCPEKKLAASKSHGKGD